MGRFLWAVAIALLLSGCGAVPADVRDAGMITLRVGTLAGTTRALFAASGLDQDLPYRIEWSVFPTGPQLVEAQRAKAVDIGLTADTPPIFAQAANTPVKIVAVERLRDLQKSPLAIVVRKHSDITTVAQLRGRRIGLTQGTILQYLVVKVLQREGIRYADIAAVNIPPEDSVAALRRGDVEALASIDPTLARTTAAVDARILVTGAGYTAGVNYQLVRTEVLEDRRRAEVILDYLRRSVRAREWADRHRDEWAQAYARLNNIPVDLASIVQDRARYGYVPITDDIVDGQQEQADTFFTLGLLPRRLDVAEMFDRRFDGRIG
jgi:sulfonate transport system substrate-binding protein